MQLWTLLVLKSKLGGFEFPNAGTMKAKYLNKGGILMTYLEVMGNMFATSENPALKDYRSSCRY